RDSKIETAERPDMRVRGGSYRIAPITHVGRGWVPRGRGRTRGTRRREMHGAFRAVAGRGAARLGWTCTVQVPRGAGRGPLLPGGGPEAECTVQVRGPAHRERVTLALPRP